MLELKYIKITTKEIIRKVKNLRKHITELFNTIKRKLKELTKISLNGRKFSKR